MPPKFGTSGLRGLVTELTPALVQRHVRAFIAACPQGRAVHVGQDLRASSPAIAQAVIAAVRAAGLDAINHGAVPTPALALASMAAGEAAVMVTGSHIPADRNGLKFYIPAGEISKADETAILAALDADHVDAAPGALHHSTRALPDYTARYLAAFGPQALRGMRIGIYQHSSVARDVMGDIMAALGAETVPLARSADTFIPVDTEAVDPATRLLLGDWAREHALDAIVSTDGDGDRPMLAGADGAILPGDVLGPLTARHLGADVLVTPVSSNTLADLMPEFGTVARTRIGSPFVIAGMEDALARDPACKVAGYEANGGFLLGFTAQGGAGPLAPLMTRDSLLPMIAPLAASRAAGAGLVTYAAQLPARFTASDRVQDVASDRSAALIAELAGDAAARAAFFKGTGPEQSCDLTDGLRVTFAGGGIVHLRGSGNAPECRCYTEAGDAQTAARLLAVHLDQLRTALA